MDFSSHFKTLSHGYLIEGNTSLIEKELCEILEHTHGIVSLSNPDFYFQSYATFTIEQAREIKELSSRKKITEGKRIFIISADSLTREASNALLKTLEEPGLDTHFFILLPSIKRVLPTIISRIQLVRHTSSPDVFFISLEEFLSSTPAKRFKLTKDIFEKLEKEEISKSAIKAFIGEVLRAKSVSGVKVGLDKDVHIASYAEDQSASLKMILEYLAIT